MKAFLALGSLACVGLNGARAVDEATIQSVQLVVLEHSYWGGGFNSPLFLVLESGLVLMRDNADSSERPAYRSAQLTVAQRDSLLSSLRIQELRQLPDTSFDYNPGWSDQHSYFVVLPTAPGQRTVQLRAASAGGDTLRSEAPELLRALFREIKAVGGTLTSPWTPDSIEVSIWSYEYAPDNPPLRWPSDWPTLDSPRWTREKSEYVDDSRSIRLPFSDGERLDSLLRVRRAKQALDVGGKKWAISYRWVFPREKAWRSLTSRLEG